MNWLLKDVVSSRLYHIPVPKSDCVFLPCCDSSGVLRRYFCSLTSVPRSTGLVPGLRTTCDTHDTLAMAAAAGDVDRSDFEDARNTCEPLAHTTRSWEIIAEELARVVVANTDLVHVQLSDGQAFQVKGEKLVTFVKGRSKVKKGRKVSTDSFFYRRLFRLASVTGLWAHACHPTHILRYQNGASTIISLSTERNQSNSVCLSGRRHLQFERNLFLTFRRPSRATTMHCDSESTPTCRPRSRKSRRPQYSSAHRLSPLQAMGHSSTE